MKNRALKFDFRKSVGNRGDVTPYLNPAEQHSTTRRRRGDMRSKKTRNIHKAAQLARLGGQRRTGRTPAIHRHCPMTDIETRQSAAVLVVKIRARALSQAEFLGSLIEPAATAKLSSARPQEPV